MAPPHYTPRLIIDNTHRVVAAPVDYDRRPQIKHVEPRLYTADELIFAGFFGGFIGCFITVALAYAWSFWL